MIDQALEHGVEVCRVLPIGAQSRECLLPARVGPAFTEVDQAQQDPERDRLSRRGQWGERFLGVLRDGERQTSPRAIAQCLVVREAEQPLTALAPEPEQRHLQEGERAGLARGVDQEPRDQLGMDIDACVLRGALDDDLQAVVAQRAELDARDLAVDVGPQRALQEGAVEIRA